MSKKKEEDKGEHQELIDDNGQTVEFLEKNYQLDYYRIESDTHFIDRMQSTLEQKRDLVAKAFADERFSDGDQIAEGFVRTATRAKQGYRKMKKKEYLTALLRTWKLFKEKIFGYNELTAAQIAADKSGEKKERKKKETAL